MSVDSSCASSSLRLGSRIVPWTPSSLGKRLANGDAVQPFENIRLASLRSKLATARLEKANLAREIKSPSTSYLGKQRATFRSTAVDVELRIIAGELQDFIAAAKFVLAAKKSPS
jgi:hypothetical protein